MVHRIVLLITAVHTLTSIASPLTVYSYDSFSSKGSLGEAIAPLFEKKYGAKVQFVSFGSAGEALNQVALEGKNTKADVVVGIDNSLIARAREMKMFAKWKNPPHIANDLQIDSERFFIPFDYGYLAFLYDSRRTKLPKGAWTLGQFVKLKELEKKVVIEDPRTSSIGLGFLIWTNALYKGEAYASFWKGMNAILFKIAPGWSGAYGLFTKKEADFVLSYTTSPAYHIEYEKTDAIKAIPFTDGHYRQVEAVGLVETSMQKDLAHKWLEFMLSREVQSQIPIKQWMFPAVSKISLPPSFQKLIHVSKTVALDPTTIQAQKETWLREWAGLVQ